MSAQFACIKVEPLSCYYLYGTYLFVLQIPFFPVVKKDLTFINLGNDSKVDGLINFEKLRMIAKEVRHICTMASAQYVSRTLLQI